MTRKSHDAVPLADHRHRDGRSTDASPKSGVSKPKPNRRKLLARGFNKRCHSLVNPAGYYRHGIDLFAEDWDNLLILDACRYDMLASADHSFGRVEKRLSRGSGTKQFLKANLDGKTLLDTVYVTANPQLYKHRDEISVTFHAEDHVWEDGWDAAEKTVTPAVLTERAIAAATAHPDKRLLVHYMQPHYPFIGSPHDFDKQGHIFDSTSSFWMEQFLGVRSIPTETVWRYYRENLALALPSVERLLAHLPGKTVITADHGNMVGERSWPLPIREWGHPSGLYTPELVTVPWAVTENGPRKQIHTAAHARDDPHRDVHKDLITQRLSDLGYI